MNKLSLVRLFLTMYMDIWEKQEMPVKLIQEIQKQDEMLKLQM